MINYDLPPVPSDYIHRVGRTARAGRGGHAVSFVTQYDVELFTAVERDVLSGAKMEELPGIGDEEEAVLLRLAKVAAAWQLAKGRLEEAGFDESLAAHKQRKREAKARLAVPAGASASGKA